MRIPRLFCLLSLSVLAGCQYLPRSYYFTPPENEPNPAWIRIVNFTQHAEIYQYEGGVRSGGAVRSGPLPLVNTQDKGMPKAGQDLTFDFYESPLRPGLETHVDMFWEGSETRHCFVSATFIPKAGQYYQFLMSSGASGTCRMSPTLVERDENGSGWHLKPNPDVTYPDGSAVGKTYYGDDRYKDPNYKPFSPPI
ncbi:hypothetical protein [Pseudomonas sp. BP8]|uniref:hypothetical protein n=1 Tax=Pseudomonas sp. BP8 TaxID=2817864 RepID=UPI001AE5D415|nr:hypothetical protein [Pseudomonas sp. BP8]MBP2261932.1 hypothetical protein [Pseudomonas sp. BP8]HDS1737192.1 hypothetical protein [Pseudomonas putida]